MRFRPGYLLVSDLVKPTWAEDELAREVNLLSATPEFVRTHGGPITREILARLPEDYFEQIKTQGRYAAINVVVSRLEAGEYPTYPHWHFDARQPTSQEDLDYARALAPYVMCMVSSVSGGISNTLLLDEEVEGTNSPFPELWGKPGLKTQAVPDGSVVYMHPWSIHASQPARAGGIRLFFRVTTFGKPCHGIIAPTKKVVVPAGDINQAVFKENT